MKLQDKVPGLSIRVFGEGQDRATAEKSFTTVSGEWSIQKRKKTVTTGQCYIQSEAGKTFHIGWVNDSGSTYSMSVLVDGVHLVDHALEPHTTDKCVGAPTKHAGKRAYHPFTFASTRGRTSKTSKPKTGNITAKIHRPTGPVKHIKIEDELLRCTASQNTAGTDKVVSDPCPNDKFVLDFETEDFPCASFEFNYGDLGMRNISLYFCKAGCRPETLQALGVIKRSPVKRKNPASDGGASKRRKPAEEPHRSEGERPNNRRTSTASSLDIVNETPTIPRRSTPGSSSSGIRQPSQRHRSQNNAAAGPSNRTRSPSIISISSSTPSGSPTSRFKREEAPEVFEIVLEFLRGSDILRGSGVLEVGRMFRAPGGIRSAGQLDVLARDEQDNPELVVDMLRTMGLTLFEVMDVRKLLKLRRRNFSLRTDRPNLKAHEKLKGVTGRILPREGHDPPQLFKINTSTNDYNSLQRLVNEQLPDKWQDKGHFTALLADLNKFISGLFPNALNEEDIHIVLYQGRTSNLRDPEIVFGRCKPALHC
ncbi:hypothetical protein C8J56DRAFT_1059240 [Mycena floridula]|nr:hypothetical protein C8J56DRAFT_1059240 [Mycena floridula]